MLSCDPLWLTWRYLAIGDSNTNGGQIFWSSAYEQCYPLCPRAWENNYITNWGSILRIPRSLHISGFPRIPQFWRICLLEFKWYAWLANSACSYRSLDLLRACYSIVYTPLDFYCLMVCISGSYLVCRIFSPVLSVCSVTLVFGIG